MKNKYFILLLFPFTILSVKSQVVFLYDEAGNQIYRGTEPQNKKQNDVRSKKIDDNIKTSLANTIANKIKVAPVPVKTDLNVFWEREIADYIVKIDLLPYNAFNIIESINIKDQKVNSYVFRMNHLPYGVYYLKFYLNDNSVYTVTVTKN